MWNSSFDLTLQRSTTLIQTSFECLNCIVDHLMPPINFVCLAGEEEEEDEKEELIDL
jgi:hypothetical protein